MNKICRSNIYYQIDDEKIEDLLQKFKTKKEFIICDENIQKGSVVIIKRTFSNQYVVKAMDTISSIAKKFNVSEDKIKSINGLKDNRLFIGQILVF